MTGCARRGRLRSCADAVHAWAGAAGRHLRADRPRGSSAAVLAVLLLAVSCGDRDAGRSQQATRGDRPLPQHSDRVWQRKAVTEDGQRVVWWRVAGERDELPESDPFDLEVRIEDASGQPVDAALEFDAEMPHHGHGMNVRPTIERTGPGRHLVRGVLLHMGGRWEIAFDLGDPDGVAWRRAQCTVEAP
ncbi:MAG: hypothetical protein RLZZ246_1330 [Planctomycetota bacterium]|jgi:hypothetical protein